MDGEFYINNRYSLLFPNSMPRNRRKARKKTASDPAIVSQNDSGFNEILRQAFTFSDQEGNENKWLQQIISAFEPLEVQSDEVIIEAEQEAEYFYLIKSGSCRLQRATDGGTLAKLTALDSFGEEALLTESLHPYRAVMLSKGVLLRLDKRLFLDWVRGELAQYIDYAPASGKQEDFVWVDVRPPKAFRYRRFPNSVNIPLSELRQYSRLLRPEQSLLTIAEDTGSAEAAMFMLLRAGLRVNILDNAEDALKTHGVQECPVDVASSVDTAREGGEVHLLKQQLREESGKLKALEHYASSLRLIRARQTEQHAKLEDRVKSLEQDYDVARSEVMKSQSQLEQQQHLLDAVQQDGGEVFELRRQLDALQNELTAATELNAKAEEEKRYALQQVKALTDQVETLKNMARECAELIDAENDERAGSGQARSREKSDAESLQAQLELIRNQASAEIKAMRAQMKQAKEDTVRLLNALDREKQRIAELEVRAVRPLSPPKEQGNPASGATTVTEEPVETLSSEGRIATILISVLCALVLTMMFLFATDSGRGYLGAYLEQHQSNAAKTFKLAP